MASAKNTDESWKTAKSMYDFGATDIDGNEVSFEKYRGHVCLIVNVACKCGLTDTNYKQLQALYNEFAESKGLRILVFPSNQFLNQEPGTNEEIKEFVKNNYNGQFDMFSKIEVNGNNTHPFWKYLKMKQTGTLGSAIKWNFTKFLVDKEGQVVKRYGPNTEPFSIKKDLENYW